MPNTVSHANKQQGESMPTKRSRKTGKRTVVEPHNGDRGDNKSGGSVVERIVRKLTRGLGARIPDHQTSLSYSAQSARGRLLQGATARNRGRQKILAIQSFSRERSHLLRASGSTVATTPASRCRGKSSGNYCHR
jgi:hypothetical protein